MIQAYKIQFHFQTFEKENNKPSSEKAEIIKQNKKLKAVYQKNQNLEELKKIFYKRHLVPFNQATHEFKNVSYSKRLEEFLFKILWWLTGAIGHYYESDIFGRWQQINTKVIHRVSRPCMTRLLDIEILSILFRC